MTMLHPLILLQKKNVFKIELRTHILLVSQRCFIEEVNMEMCAEILAYT